MGGDTEPDSNLGQSADLDVSDDLDISLDRPANSNLDVDVDLGVDLDADIKEGDDNGREVDNGMQEEIEVNVDSEDPDAQLEKNANVCEDLNEDSDQSLDLQVKKQCLSGDIAVQNNGELLDSSLDDNVNFSDGLEAQVDLNKAWDVDVGLQIADDDLELDHNIGEDGAGGLACAFTTSDELRTSVGGRCSSGEASEGSEEHSLSGEHCDRSVK